MAPMPWRTGRAGGCHWALAPDVPTIGGRARWGRELRAFPLHRTAQKVRKLRPSWRQPYGPRAGPDSWHGSHHDSLAPKTSVRAEGPEDW